MSTKAEDHKAHKPGDMKMFVDVQKVYLYRESVGFRKAIDGLAMIVEQDMKLSAFEAALFS